MPRLKDFCLPPGFLYTDRRMGAQSTSAAPRMLILLSALAPAAALAVTLAGCGDAILCDSSPLVVIQAPTSAITVDGDPAAPGVQVDVRVRSTLLPADGLELVVLDAAGAEVATLRMPAGAGGSTVFPGVTLPSPRATLRATGRSACGLADDEVELEVVAGSGCDLQIQPSPRAVAGYPVGVLAAALDPDPAPGFQAQIAVATRAGWTVELFGDTGQGEQPRGLGLADSMGLVRFPQTLADGPAAFRAVCRGAGGEVLPSLTASAIVDTTPPACDFTRPLPGTSITPAHDADGDLGNGVQLALEARIDGGDAAGEPVSLTITSDAGVETVDMTPVDAQGTSTANVTLDPAATPATFQLTLAARDRAGNLCTRTRPYDVVYDGCSIEVIAPTAPVTVDADGVAGNGSQVDIQLAIDPACIGRTVTSTCGANSPAGVVPASGPLTLRADLCGSSPCEAQATCTFRVSSPAGVETQASAVIAFDDQGPAVSVEIAAPPLPCGAQITPASDVDPAAPGVQIVARVVAADATEHELALTNISGTQTVPAPGDVTITVAPGLNLLTGAAEDSLGNPGTSPTCTVALADLAVAIDPPAAGGVLGRADGTVSGGALTFPLCGTLDRPGAAVSIRIDGGAPLPAAVNGTTWCRTVTLAEADHAVSVMATKGLSFGDVALPLRVDLTPPDPIAAYGGTVPTRQRVGLAWTAPADDGGPAAAYVAKWSAAPLTEANFDTAGTVIPTGAPRSPGAAEAVELFPARMGTPYWLGVAAVDRAGNRAPPAIVGPITPAFDQLGPIFGPNPGLGNLAMGAAIAHGRFNDDDYDDLAIAAPTQHAGGLLLAGAVYVYLGGPGGIAPSPSLTVVGGAPGALAGSGLAAVPWSRPGRDDLVIGAPGADGGAGRLYVLAGGAGFPTGTITAGAAALQIGVHPTAGGWFAGGGLGAATAAADVDGDGVRDLVASAIRGGGSGGIVILYGGTVTASVLLSDTDTSGLGSAIVEYMPDPLALPGRNLGTYLHAVGPTAGPLDPDDDLVVAYEDDIGSVGESLYILRGNGERPTAPLTQRAFTVGRDVRIDLVTSYPITEFGAQAVSIADLDGDGSSDIAISAYRNLNGAGQVLVIDGDTVGTDGVAKTNQPGVVLTTIQGSSGMRLGAVLAAHDARSSNDIDGDGAADLLVGGVVSNVARLFVWFGGTLPRGSTTPATAAASIIGPSVFGFSSARPHGPAGQARWAGDLNGDGLDDLCWSSPYDNATGLDGAFAVLFDGAP
jgi:hypothetical protein